MQWLIDLIAAHVIETIGIPPVYINRGDPDEWDFVLGDFIRDYQWHDLDLSTIVPEGTKLVHFRLHTSASTAHKSIAFKHPDCTYSKNCMILFSQVPQITTTEDFWCAVNAARCVKYRAASEGFTALNLLIRGWLAK